MRNALFVGGQSQSAQTTRPADFRARAAHLRVFLVVGSCLIGPLDGSFAGRGISAIEPPADRISSFHVRYRMWEYVPDNFVPQSELHDAIIADGVETLVVDTYSKTLGRRIEFWTPRTRRLAFVTSRKGTPDSLTSMIRFGGGNDYFALLLPQVSGLDVFKILKRHPTVKRSCDENHPNLLVFEIPVETLSEFNDLGVRLVVDTSRENVPVEVESYIRVGMEKKTLSHTLVSVSQSGRGLWVPVRALYSEFTLSLQRSGESDPGTHSFLEVDEANSSWNDNTDPKAFDDESDLPPTTTVSESLHGWKDFSIPAPKPGRIDEGSSPSTLKWLLSLNAVALGLVVVLWYFKSHRSKPTSGSEAYGA